ncbi:MAG: type I phosphomannose isomerase catalytic subunit [Flavobacterium sp.]
MLYPLVFTPIFKDRIWGGSRLAELFGKAISSGQTGESWELSAVPGDVSVVTSGLLKGKTLSELIATYPEELLGKRVVERYGATFPLLFKFLDARDDLSIQVHPDDNMAQEYHGGFGKTEMWYVLDAEPGAELIVGFQQETSPEQYLKALEQSQVVSLLKRYPVEKGDVFFLETGTVHAIGKGTVIAEIQQTSDITYRIYDYNRRDAQGQLRELHTDLALKAIHFGVRQPKMQYSKQINHNNQVVQCPYFTTSYLPLEGELVLNTDEPVFQVLMCLEGEFYITMENQSYAFSKGDTVLVPAVWSQSRLSGTAELLVVSV